MNGSDALNPQVERAAIITRLEDLCTIAEMGCSKGPCFTDSTVCGFYDTEECPHEPHPEAPM